MKTRRICKSSDTRRIFEITNEALMIVTLSNSRTFQSSIEIAPAVTWHVEGDFAGLTYWIQMPDNGKLKIVENIADGTLYAKVYT